MNKRDVQQGATPIQAILRTKTGKGSARQARRLGNIPATMYGGGQLPTSISIHPKPILVAYGQGKLYTQLFHVQMEDGSLHQVLAHQIQQHPVTDQLIHVDFKHVMQGSSVHLDVPIHFINEDQCAALKQGGLLNITAHRVKIACLPDAIPAAIVIDLQAASRGEVIHASNLVLPEGVTLACDPQLTIATIASSGAASASA
jgi:large subunit ribosomal protein L25